MNRIRVVLADDHPIVLAGVRTLLGADPEIELVGEADNGGEALSDDLRPRAGRRRHRRLDARHQRPRTDERVDAECPGDPAPRAHGPRGRGLRPAPAPGRCAGYLLKRSAAEDLPRAVRAIADGRRLSRPCRRRPCPGGPIRLGRRYGPGEAGEALSPRETEILRLIAQGFSNKEIARRIDVSVKSVETYKARAAEKLRLRTRAEIIRYGASHGWLDALTLR